MSSLAARVTSQQQFAFCPHTSVSGESWQLIQRGVTSGAGAAGGTTLVDAAYFPGADTYNGRYWLRCTSGTNSGLMKRVVDYASPGTFTLENNGFPNQVASGVNYELWLSPEPVVVVDSATSATMVDAVRSEPDDYWNKYYAVPITGSGRGRVEQITDFISATGTFVIANNLGDSLAAGDVVLLRKFIEVSDINNGLTESYEPSPMDRLDGNKGDGRVVAKSGTFGFSTEVTSLDGTSAAGAAAIRAELAHMMQAAGYKEIIGTSSTTGAGSTTSAISVATGSWENHPIGSPVIYDGQLAFVTSTVDGGGGVDTVNVAPPLAQAPLTGNTLRAGIAYRRNRNGSSDGDYLGCVLEYEIDGIRYTMTGCRGNMTVQGDGRLMFAWEFQVDHWIRELERAPYYAGAAYTTQRPILANARLCYIDSTKKDLGGITASLNNEVAPKMVQGASGMNGRNGFAHVRANAGATFRQLMDTSIELPADERFGARTSFAWTVIFGGAYRAAFGVRIPAARLVQDPKPEDSSGMVDAPQVISAHDPGTATDGDSTATRLADFIVAFG